MKTFIFKLFQWFKDRFSFLFTVFIRLHIGETKKEEPTWVPTPADEDSAKTEKGTKQYDN